MDEYAKGLQLRSNYLLNKVFRHGTMKKRYAILMTYYQHKWDKLITGNFNLTMQVESFIKQFRYN